MEELLKKKHKHWLNKYLSNCAHLNKSELTIKNYRSDLHKFLTWYESKNPTLITKANGQTITIYKEFLTTGGDVLDKTPSKLVRLLRIFRIRKLERKTLYIQKPLAVSSKKRHLSAVKNFFEYLKQDNEDKNKIFRINPVKTKIHAIKLKEVDVKNTKMLGYKDWEKLREGTYRTKERLIIYLLYWAGLRLSELVHLRFEDFDSLNNTIRFKRKGGYVHELIPQQAKEIFKQLHYYRENINTESEYLFINSKGERLSSRSMYNIIMVILKKNNCSFGLSPHSFRKACATNLYRKTKDLLLVRDYLNHHDAKVTQTYIDKKTLQLDYIQYM